MEKLAGCVKSLALSFPPFLFAKSPLHTCVSRIYETGRKTNARESRACNLNTSVDFYLHALMLIKITFYIVNGGEIILILGTIHFSIPYIKV